MRGGLGMKFEEKEYINLTHVPTMFVYFLLNNKEVVYVGQTKTGLARVYNHTKSKKFDEIYVIVCDDIDELNYLEGYYIVKYTPKYNKNYNTSYLVKICDVVSQINQTYNCHINLHKVTKMIKELDIELVTVPDSDNYYLTVDDYSYLISCIDDYKKGAPLNEIFNI